jgi:large subunit ribosomal protein L4
MSVPVLNPDGVLAGEAAFSGPVAEQQIKPHLIHETVVAELGHRRAGTHSTKNRGEVRGGGKKPWRQKGTGRARQGSIRAPQWRGGGVTFGPTPRDHGGKVNRKVRAQAFRAALRAHADRGSMAIMDPTGWDAPSSKRAAAYLFQAPEGIAARPLLIVLDDPDGIEGLSFRNLDGVYVLPARELEVVDVMAGRCLLVERAVWERFCGGELAVTDVEATPKAIPKRTPPPAPKPIQRTKKKDDEKPKRSRKKAVSDEPDVEVTDAPVVADADEAVAETAVEAKPKRTRKKAEVAADATVEEGTADAETVAEEATAEPDAEAEVVAEKPKRTRKKAEPAAEADAEATQDEDGAE